eukprot:1931682-Rhodomonas_salina.2
MSVPGVAYRRPRAIQNKGIGQYREKAQGGTARGTGPASRGSVRSSSRVCSSTGSSCPRCSRPSGTRRTARPRSRTCAPARAIPDESVPALL